MKTILPKVAIRMKRYSISTSLCWSSRVRCSLSRDMTASRWISLQHLKRWREFRAWSELFCRQRPRSRKTSNNSRLHGSLPIQLMLSQLQKSEAKAQSSTDSLPRSWWRCKNCDQHSTFSVDCDARICLFTSANLRSREISPASSATRFCFRE